MRIKTLLNRSKSGLTLMGALVRLVPRLLIHNSGLKHLRYATNPLIRLSKKIIKRKKGIFQIIFKKLFLPYFF